MEPSVGIAGKPSGAGHATVGAPTDKTWRRRLPEEESLELLGNREFDLVERVERTGGTPLERQVDETSSLITFLWRGHARTVTLAGPVVVSNYRDYLFDRVTGTDLWHLSIEVPAATRTGYVLALDDSLAEWSGTVDWASRTVGWRIDDMNPRVFRDPAHPLNPASGRVYSLTELDGTPPPLRSSEDRDCDPFELLVERSFDDPRLSSRRRVWVLDAEEAEQTLIVLDGWYAITAARTPQLLHQLQTSRVIRPTRAVFYDSGTVTDRQREVMFDEGLSDVLASSLPLAVGRAGVTPAASERVHLAGMSGGGGAVVFAAARHPKRFAGVLAQSSSAYWAHNGKRAGWIVEELGSRPPFETRFVIEVGLLEIDEIGANGSLLAGNRKLARALTDLAVPCTLRELACGHDPLVYGDALARSLVELLS